MPAAAGHREQGNSELRRPKGTLLAGEPAPPLENGGPVPRGGQARRVPAELRARGNQDGKAMQSRHPVQHP